jgi:hypothetical protein
MKKYKIIFWVTTLLIFFLQGIMPILTLNTAETKQGMEHLGYPPYFAPMLAFFKLFGAMALLIPRFPSLIKEWAYAGFAIDFVCAFVSIVIIDGISAVAFAPVVALMVLILSYISFHKLKQNRRSPGKVFNSMSV